MANVQVMFIMTLTINLMLVTMGFSVDNLSVSFFDQDSNGVATRASDSLVGSVSPKNFSATSANTGDPANTEFKIIDALGVIRSGLSILVSVFVAPLLMALQLSWPAYLVVLVAIPWTLSFWISLILMIRGVSS